MILVAFAGAMFTSLILGIFIGKRGIKADVNSTEYTDGEVYSVCTQDKEFIKKIAHIDGLYAVLFNVVWGTFYYTEMKHGNADEKYSSASEALHAYRDYICQEISDSGISLDD